MDFKFQRGRKKERGRENRRRSLFRTPPKRGDNEEGSARCSPSLNFSLYARQFEHVAMGEG